MPDKLGSDQGDLEDLGCFYPRAYRTLIAAALACTVWITWPLWQVRESPPLLPLLAVPQWGMGWLLLMACVALVFFPRVGLACCWAAFGWAIISDQTRLQPEIPSMLLLAIGTVGWPSGVLVARASLFSLWFSAGVSKLLSPGFYTVLVPWLLGDSAIALLVGAVLAAAEILLAVGCLLPKTRQAVALSAVFLHAGIILLLSPVFLNWNEAVWPWNAVLLVSAAALVLPWQGVGFGSLWIESSGWVKIWATSLLLMPVGYWLGVIDANLAGCVYANNTPRAFVCTGFSRTDINEYCSSLNVPLPPAHRLYRPFFLGVGRAGTWLEVDDPRLIARLLGFDKRKIFWNDLLPGTYEIVVPDIQVD